MNESQTDLILQEAFEKLKSKFAGAAHAVGQFAKTGSVNVAKAGYKAQQIVKRFELFKKNVGSSLQHIKQCDPANTLGLTTRKALGPIQIKGTAKPKLLNRQVFQDTNNIDYTYDAKTNAWLAPGGKKNAYSAKMTQDFLAKYHPSIGGEIFGEKQNIESEIQSLVLDLAKEFNIKGTNTQAVLNQLNKLKTVPELNQTIAALNKFLSEIKNKTKLNIVLPKQLSVVKRKPRAKTKPAAPAPAAPAAPAATASLIPKGTTYKIGSIDAEYDGTQWVDSIRNIPFAPQYQDRISQIYISDKYPISSTTPATTTPATTTSATPATPATPATKAGKLVPENITKLTYKEFFV